MATRYRVTKTPKSELLPLFDLSTQMLLGYCSAVAMENVRLKAIKDVQTGKKTYAIEGELLSITRPVMARGQFLPKLPEMKPMGGDGFVKLVFRPESEPHYVDEKGLQVKGVKKVILQTGGFIRAEI